MREIRTIELPCFGIKLKVAGEVGAVVSDLDGEEFDGIESMILAHAIAGVDVESPAYIFGIETAVEAVENHLVAEDEYEKSHAPDCSYRCRGECDCFRSEVCSEVEEEE